MRKLSSIFIGLLIAGTFAVAAPALAEPSDACGADPAATGTDGENSLSVCVDGVGAVTAAQVSDERGEGGYIIADGDSDTALNAVSSCFQGFAGVQATSDGPTVVAEGEGDYSYPHTADGDPDPTVCAPA